MAQATETELAETTATTPLANNAEKDTNANPDISKHVIITLFDWSDESSDDEEEEPTQILINQMDDDDYFKILSLKVNDKLELYGADYDSDGEHIGIVINIEETDEWTGVALHYDGWGTNWDEEVAINHSQKTLLTNVRPSHTDTPHFPYPANSMPICEWEERSKCGKCKEFGNYDECKDCMKLKYDKEIDEYEGMLATIRAANSGKFRDIANIIADYAMGVTFQCSNVINKCQNIIHFDTKYKYDNYKWAIQNRRMRKTYMYRYHPKYANDEGTHSIFGKLTRMFCLECTNELAPCRYGDSQGCRSKEAMVIYTPHGKAECHNHKRSEECKILLESSSEYKSLYGDKAASVLEFQQSASWIAWYNDDPKELFSRLRSVAKKLLKDDVRYRMLHTKNSKVAERLLGYEGVLDFLMLLGFEWDAMKSKLVCAEKPTQQFVRNAIEALNTVASRLGLGRK